MLSKDLVVRLFALPLTACGSLTNLARVWHNVLGVLANLCLALACVPGFGQDKP